MSAKCQRCGHDESVGRFCPACGAEQRPEVAAAVSADPFIGMSFAGRYQITELIAAGGMGRVYRAKQTLLDREVALKVIHPHLLTTEQVVARFLSEAKTSSRMNHPNVVSVFDFGRTPDDEGAHLYLVMEILAGTSLATLLEAGEVIAPRRIAKILTQVLGALGEAHELGITHRDIKPENVVLTNRRGASDHVKVIDFGIATVAGQNRLSQAGQLLGTPHYMAPELLVGKVGPSVDLYAVGIMLFELVTGVVPFDDDESIAAILTKHSSAPRPDPRRVAPARNISAELAAVCMRAIDVDPAKRYPDAESFAAAIDAAMEAQESAARAALNGATGRLSIPDGFRAGASDADVLRRGTSETVSAIGADSSGPHAMSAESSGRHRAVVDPGAQVGPRAADASGRHAAIGAAVDPRRPTERLSIVPIDATGLFGREAVLEKVWREVQTHPHVAHVIWGREGTGRSALLLRIVSEAKRRGYVAKGVVAPTPPRDEIGYRVLQTIIASLAGLPATDASLRSGAIAEANSEASTALRSVFDATVMNRDVAMAGIEGALALRWAVERAVNRANGAGVLLAIDDIDRLDAASRLAVEALLDGRPLDRFTVVMTSTQKPEEAFANTLSSTHLAGVSRRDAEAFLAARKKSQGTLLRDDDDIEPLYLERLERWDTQYGQQAPRGLDDIVEWQIRALASGPRRVMQALAALGGGTAQELKSLVPEVAVDAAIAQLTNEGFLRVAGELILPSHRIFAQVAAATTPAIARPELHQRALATVPRGPETLELRAYHAIRAAGDPVSYQLVSRAADLRASRGDHAGAAALLEDGIHAVRIEIGGPDRTRALATWIEFARALAAALIALYRAADGTRALEDVLAATPQGSVERALVMEQLAFVCEQRGAPLEAARWRTEGSQIAVALGDVTLVERIRRGGSPVRTGRHRRPVFSTTGRMKTGSKG
jgi:serine/threonine-protein kinase